MLLATENSGQNLSGADKLKGSLTAEEENALAFFGALALFLSTVELLIPRPLPFMRLGLANLPLLFSLKLYSPRFTLSLTVLKILGQGIIHGTLFSYIFVFSAAGSLASAMCMLLTVRVFGCRMSLAGTGVIGSFASNVTQIVFARFFLLGKGAWLIAPPFLVLGCAAGFLLGIAAERVLEKSPHLLCPLPPPLREEAPPGIPKGPLMLALFGFCCALPFLFLESLCVKASLCGLFVLLTLLSGGKVRLLPNVLVALPVIFSHLLAPSGKVYFSLGSFPVTEGALLRGTGKTLTVIGLVYLSRLTLRPGLRLPGSFGRLCAAMLIFFERIMENLRLFRENKNAKSFWTRLDAVFEKARERG
jgi:uncharacterized membrane protein